MTIFLLVMIKIRHPKNRLSIFVVAASQKLCYKVILQA